MSEQSWRTETIAALDRIEIVTDRMEKQRADECHQRTNLGAWCESVCSKLREAWKR